MEIFNNLTEKEQRVVVANVRQQLHDLDLSHKYELLTRFFTTHHDSWKASILDDMMDNAECERKFNQVFVIYVIENVGIDELFSDDEGCSALEPSDEWLKEKILQQAEAFFDEHGFNVERWEEDGVCVGLEVEGYTDGDVDMIHYVDGRHVDMADEDWWKIDVQVWYENFSVDEEIDIHRQDERYRNAFTCRQSVKDFESWEQRLKELAEAV